MLCAMAKSIASTKMFFRPRLRNRRKDRFPFVCAMTGSACAAVFSVLTGVESLSIGVGGLPGILSIRPDKMLFFAIAMLIAIVVPFILTTIFGRARGVK